MLSTAEICYDKPWLQCHSHCPLVTYSITITNNNGLYNIGHVIWSSDLALGLYKWQSFPYRKAHTAVSETILDVRSTLHSSIHYLLNIGNNILGEGHIKKIVLSQNNCLFLEFHKYDNIYSTLLRRSNMFEALGYCLMCSLVLCSPKLPIHKSRFNPYC
jgi:hypothetical protein